MFPCFTAVVIIVRSAKSVLHVQDNKYSKMDDFRGRIVSNPVTLNYSYSFLFPVQVLTVVFCHI